MGRRRKKSPNGPDEPAHPNCKTVERALLAALEALDWRVNNRPSVRICSTKYLAGLRWRTVFMFKRPEGGEELTRWVNILAHEVAHVVGLTIGSFRPDQYRLCGSPSEERIAEFAAAVLCYSFELPYVDWSYSEELGPPSQDEMDEGALRADVARRLGLGLPVSWT